MRLAVLSWRYLDHPQSGGAEVLTHEVLRRLVAASHAVTCFTATYPGSGPAGELDGVRIVRRGVQWTVHAHAWRWLRTRRDAFDIVVDQINTIPFFTPLYLPADRRRFHINQLARGFWFRETRGPFRLVAPIGYLAEPWYLRAYRRTRGLTISDSVREELIGLGFRERIDVIPMALEAPRLDALPPVAPESRIVILGRLTPAKFIEEGIEVVAALHARGAPVGLDVIGAGDDAYRARLEALVAARGLRDVIFHGRVTAERKAALLRDAWLHVFTSHREGWGLTVSEAAAMGTPSIGYDVTGVRDSIGDRRLVTRVGDVAGLASIAAGLAADPDAYTARRAEAWERTAGMDYDRTAAAFATALGLD